MIIIVVVIFHNLYLFPSRLTITIVIDVSILTNRKHYHSRHYQYFRHQKLLFLWLRLHHFRMNYYLILFNINDN